MLSVLGCRKLGNVSKSSWEPLQAVEQGRSTGAGVLETELWCGLVTSGSPQEAVCSPLDKEGGLLPRALPPGSSWKLISGTPEFNSLRVDWCVDMIVFSYFGLKKSKVLGCERSLGTISRPHRHFIFGDYGAHLHPCLLPE